MRVARNGGLILMDGHAPLESTVLRRYAPLSRPPVESFRPHATFPFDSSSRFASYQFHETKRICLERGTVIVTVLRELAGGIRNFYFSARANDILSAVILLAFDPGSLP